MTVLQNEEGTGLLVHSMQMMVVVIAGVDDGQAKKMRRERDTSQYRAALTLLAG